MIQLLYEYEQKKILKKKSKEKKYKPISSEDIQDKFPEMFL